MSPEGVAGALLNVPWVIMLLSLLKDAPTWGQNKKLSRDLEKLAGFGYIDNTIVRGYCFCHFVMAGQLGFYLIP